jgi:two-component system response regulator PilR (NtrC family)
MKHPLALIIDDEPDLCRLLEITLNQMDIQAISVHTINEAKRAIKKYQFDLCLTDMRLPDGNGLDWIAYFQKEFSQIPIAMITAHGNIETAIQALKLGAFDFISKPINLVHFRNTIQEALKTKTALTQITDGGLIGQSPAIQTLRENITKVIRSQAPVHISGPTGAGKELVARIIHQSGARRDGPFVPVNCGAIPQELMESEFFGHIKGSFTGATHDKMGFFQTANKGTLFLDEVADLPLSMQVKLLRAVQEKAIRPVGSPHEIEVDVRILSATHKNLQALVAQNLFRQDLYYRINVIELKVPSLRERQEDIPLLTQHFLNKLCQQSGITIPSLSSEAQDALNQYPFPGNVRELENILERAIVLSSGKTIECSDLQLSLPQNTSDNTLTDSLEGYLIEQEKRAILDAIEKCDGNKTAAAKLLGISFRTLRYRLKKLGIDSH